MIFDVLWIGWAALFGIIEAAALISRTKHGTLSDKLRRLFRTQTKGGRTVWAVVFGLFAGLFALHISGKGAILW